MRRARSVSASSPSRRATCVGATGAPGKSRRSASNGCTCAHAIPDKPVVAEFSGSIGEIPLVLEGHFGPLAALRAKQWPWPVSVKGEVAGRKTEVTTKVRETQDGLEASELVLLVGNSKMRGTLVYAARAPRPLRSLQARRRHADAGRPRDRGRCREPRPRRARSCRSPRRSLPKPDGRLFFVDAAPARRAVRRRCARRARDRQARSRRGADRWCRPREADTRRRPPRHQRIRRQRARRQRRRAGWFSMRATRRARRSCSSSMREISTLRR